MNSKIQKIKNYYNDNGLKETLKKIYNYTSFRLKIKNPSKSNSVYRLSKKEKETIITKTLDRIYIFTNIPYFDVGGRSTRSTTCKNF